MSCIASVMMVLECKSNGSEVLFVIFYGIFYVGVPICTLVVLFRAPNDESRAPKDESWIGLFLKRKALEEKQKIERLNKPE